MLFGKKLIIISLSLIPITVLQDTILARSVYVVSDTETRPDSTSIIQSYDIQDTSLVYQAQYESDRWGAVGLAIDSDLKFSFDKISFSGIIKHNKGRSFSEKFKCNFRRKSHV